MVRKGMRNTPRAEVQHAQIESVHAPVVSPVEIVVRYNCGPTKCCAGQR